MNINKEKEIDIEEKEIDIEEKSLNSNENIKNDIVNDINKIDSNQQNIQEQNSSQILKMYQFEEGKEYFSIERKNILLKQEDFLNTKRKIIEDIILISKLLKDRVFLFESITIYSNIDKTKLNYFLQTNDQAFQLRRDLIEFLTEK